MERDYEGELDDGSRPSVHYARDYFLQIVNRLVPEVLIDLAGEPLDFYRRSGIHISACINEQELVPISVDDSSAGDGGWTYAYADILPNWLTPFESNPHADDERLSSLRHKIFEWSRKWNLNEPWCRVRAYNTLYS